ncbi:MAG: 4-hydroxy-tetrahydrodipicolinate reductase [Bacteroidetes bacterium]|nr:4-hydroxy-tetrahydrodipicolinate reductase [Bacteroidota bacterium]
MKIALLGYGKMGQEIEKIAIERGHEIVLKINIDNAHDLTNENLKKADVAIEFSTPETAYSNIQKCFELNVPIVVGTTGWLHKMEEVQNAAQKNGKGFFYSSNYSIGVNVFFEINKHLAKLMNNYPSYKIEMEEIHHTQKLDAPSGTAITLAEGIIENTDRKTKWVNDKSSQQDELEIISLRIENIPGTHTVSYNSEIDEIFIRHTAKNRKGFALGAVIAAEFMKGKSGFYGMKDLIKF